jgi:mitochondrial chaperone BCS1
LDPALLRPGRIDKKVQYSLATKDQASALFTRFFPESRFGTLIDNRINKSDETNTILPYTPEKPSSTLPRLAETFAAGVPQHEFSTAELQGYLLSCKKTPESAAAGIDAWVEQERVERREREEREEKRKQKLREAKEKREVSQLRGPLARLGGVYLPSPPSGESKITSLSPPLAYPDGLEQSHDSHQPSNVKEEADNPPGPVFSQNIVVNGKSNGDSVSDSPLNSPT